MRPTLSDSRVRTVVAFQSSSSTLRVASSTIGTIETIVDGFDDTYASATESCDASWSTDQSSKRPPSKPNATDPPDSPSPAAAISSADEPAFLADESKATTLPAVASESSPS